MVLEPTPPLAPTKAKMRPSGLRLGIAIEPGDRFDDLQLVQRRHQIFADALAHQLAIENDVVEMADDDDLGGGVADLGQLIELASIRSSRWAARLDDQHIRRRLRLEDLEGAEDAAELDLDMGARQPAVGGGHLHGLDGLLVVAEDADVDARDHRDDRRLLGRGIVGW